MWIFNVVSSHVGVSDNKIADKIANEASEML